MCFNIVLFAIKRQILACVNLLFHSYSRNHCFHSLINTSFFYFRHFVGTYVSTFSFRIQEEREILGFDPETTFNRLCSESEEECEQPSKWKIVYWYFNLLIFVITPTFTNKLFVSSDSSISSDYVGQLIYLSVYLGQLKYLSGLL